MNRRTHLKALAAAAITPIGRLRAQADPAQVKATQAVLDAIATAEADPERRYIISVLQPIGPTIPTGRSTTADGITFFISSTPLPHISAANTGAIPAAATW